MSVFKPLLAANVEFEFVDYTNLWVSPKLDGIRAIIVNGEVLSRSLKPIPNSYVQRMFGRRQLDGYDGELIVGEPNSATVYRDTCSAVMSRDGVPEVTFHVFDHFADPELEYQQRYERLQYHGGVQLVEQHQVRDEAALLALEQGYLQQGYEGVMLRKYHGEQSRYKFGRSTAREGTLLKLKRFTDDEAVVYGVEEELENRNEATTNALGHTERSHHLANKVGKWSLGNLLCRTPEGVEFSIGTGFSSRERKELWRIRDTLPGRIVKYKSFRGGVKDAPRFPVFLGWRDPIDLG
jgi:DNA ligase-1